jgi:hypothetical protein
MRELLTDKRVQVVAGLVVLVFLSGCSILGGGDISDEQLLKDTEYDWDRNASLTYNVTTAPLLSFSSNSYQAVIDVDNDSEPVELSRDTLLRGEQSVGINSLQFRFANGTIVDANHTGLDAEQGGSKTKIQFPETEGQVAYRSSWGGAGSVLRGSPRTWRIDGAPDRETLEVRMPNGARTDLPFFSRTLPGGHSTSVEDDRATIRWDDFDGGTISVRYYLVRDLWLFGGIFLVGGLAAIVGASYYYRGMKRAKEKREEVGLDVEVGDEDDDGPPPGMR